ncbi:MAG: transposase [Alphaproteobacteria bacterium]
MPAPLSLDLRERLVEAVGSGGSIRQAARRYSVSPSAAIKLMQRVETTGSLEPEPSGGRKPLLLEPHAEALAGMVADDHDMTLVEIQGELERRFDVTAGLSTIHRMLRRLGLKLKKSR